MGEEIIISDKFAPLFRLLSCREEIENGNKSEYLKKLSLVDTVLISGGRDASKSHSKACFEIIAAADYNHRILSTRYTLASTDNSIIKALSNRAEDLNRLNDFDFQSKEIYALKGKGLISITGQKTSSGNQTAKLKSIEDYSMFLTDEAEELLSFEEWRKIKRSIRSKDVQPLSILVFNPPTREHWIAQKFYKNVPDGFCGIIDNVMYIHSTYLDNGKANMADNIWREYEALRKRYEHYESLTNDEQEISEFELKRDWEDYKYRILGGFKRQADGVVYDRYEIGEFREDLESVYGLDFGSNDPDALTKVGIDFKEKTIYIKQLYHKNNTSFEGLFQVLKTNVGFDGLIVADTSGRRLINDYYNMGINIKKANKQEKVEQLKHLKGWKLVVDPNSPDLIESFNNYSWHDKKSGAVKHEYSDLMDSWRYAAYDIINPSVAIM